MTSGIYKLTFSDGNDYIGKSVNIEKRWAEHTKSMQLGKAAAKMQAAYKRCGLPDGEILFEAHPDHIDFLEAQFIWKCQPSLNTNQTPVMDQDEFVAIGDNDHFMKESTGQHVMRMVTQRKNIEALEYEVENLLEGYEVPEYHKKELWYAQAAMHAAQAELRDYKRLPWYKRIFI